MQQGKGLLLLGKKINPFNCPYFKRNNAIFLPVQLLLLQWCNIAEWIVLHLPLVLLKDSIHKFFFMQYFEVSFPYQFSILFFLRNMFRILFEEHFTRKGKVAALFLIQLWKSKSLLFSHSGNPAREMQNSTFWTPISFSYIWRVPLIHCFQKEFSFKIGKKSSSGWH